MPDIPDDLVIRNIEHAVYCKRQLYHSKIRRQMTAVLRYGLNDPLAYLSRKTIKLLHSHFFYICGRVYRIQKTLICHKSITTRRLQSKRMLLKIICFYILIYA